MKFTKKQLAELETLEWFFPDFYKRNGLNWKDITDDDKKHYFLKSERGIGPEKETIGYQILLLSKERRGTHCETSPGKTTGMYESGVLECSVPYWTLLGGESKKEIPPRSVIDYMKKAMFRGVDAETIEKVYQEVLWKWTPWYKKIWFRLSEIGK